MPSATSTRRTPPSPLPVEPYFQAIPGSEPFLQAIAEEPDDDTLRLVFADWLEDAGHAPRADFIRVQCELAGRSTTRAHQLQERERTLLRTHQAVWLAGLDGVLGLRTHQAVWLAGLNGVLGPVFQRGMLEVLALSDFVKLARNGPLPFDVRTALIDTATPRRLVSLLSCDSLRFLVGLSSRPRLKQELITVLGRWPAVSELRHLYLHRSITEDATERLASLPFFSQLRSLNLGYSRLGPRRLLALLGSQNFPALRRLELELCHLDDRAAQAIAASEKLSGLTFLDLSRNKIQATGGSALAVSPSLKNLVHLNLTGNDLGVTARQALADAKQFPALRYLAVDGHVIQNDTGVGMTRVQEWIRHATATRPAHLDLSDGGITREAMQALLESPAFGSVTSLNLRHALVKPDVLAELAGSPRLAQITALDLSNNRLKSAHAKLLAQSPHAANLTELNLERNEITLAGAEAVVTSPHLKKLEHLNLKANKKIVRLIEHSPRFAAFTRSETPGRLVIDFYGEKPDNDFACTLAGSPYLADYTELALTCWGMSDDGVIALAESPNVANLTALRLTTCWNVGAAGVKALIASPHLGGLKRLEMSHLKVASTYRPLMAKRWPGTALSVRSSP